MVLMSRKGISPLIATVLLIAFTMAIAGIMATWATSFVQTKITETENQTAGTCSGSISLDAGLINSSGYAIVVVDTANKDLTNWKAYILYDDPRLNENVELSNSSIILSVGDVHTFTFNYSSSNPRTIRITAGNCPSIKRTDTLS